MYNKINNILENFGAYVAHTRLTLKQDELKTTEQLALDLKLTDPQDHAILQLILHFALRSELLSPDSMLEFTTTLSKTFRKKAVCKQVLEISLSPTVTSAHGMWLNLTSSADGLLSDKKLSKIFQTAIELAGLHGRVFIERSANSKTSVELSQGYTFCVTTNSANRKVLLDTRVVAIEGYVEAVSELNALFQQLVETKEPCAVFARGFTEDVYSTVQANNARGVFNVSLFVVPFELEGINMLNDIAIASGASLVSTNLGNLISTTNLDRAGFFKRISVVPGAVTCINSKTAIAVRNQVQRLLQKSQEAEIDDIKKMIDKRIKALMSSSVVIRLPDDKFFVRNSMLLDKALRAAKSSINYGFINGKPAVNFLVQKLAEECSATLMNVGYVVVTD